MRAAALDYQGHRVKPLQATPNGRRRRSRAHHGLADTLKLCNQMNKSPARRKNEGEGDDPDAQFQYQHRTTAFFLLHLQPANMLCHVNIAYKNSMNSTRFEFFAPFISSCTNIYTHPKKRLILSPTYGPLQHYYSSSKVDLPYEKHLNLISNVQAKNPT